jgi:hypothetical protein
MKNRLDSGADVRPMSSKRFNHKEHNGRCKAKTCKNWAFLALFPIKAFAEQSRRP